MMGSSLIAHWCSVMVLCVASAPAQTQEDLAKRRDAKLQSEFLQDSNWTTDYDVARGMSAKSGKLILAYFTRSYAP